MKRALRGMLFRTSTPDTGYFSQAPSPLTVGQTVSALSASSAIILLILGQNSVKPLPRKTMQVLSWIPVRPRYHELYNYEAEFRLLIHLLWEGTTQISLSLTSLATASQDRMKPSWAFLQYGLAHTVGMVNAMYVELVTKQWIDRFSTYKIGFSST